MCAQNSHLSFLNILPILVPLHADPALPASLLLQSQRYLLPKTNVSQYLRYATFRGSYTYLLEFNLSVPHTGCDERCLRPETDPSGESLIQITKLQSSSFYKIAFSVGKQNNTSLKQNLYVVYFRVGLISLVLKVFGKADESHYCKSPMASPLIQA